MATVLMAFLIAMTLKIDLYPMSVLLFGSICGIFVLSRRQMTGERRQLMLAGLVVGVTNAILLITVYLLSATVTDDPIPSLTKAIAYGLLGSGILSGILTFGALPYLESLFKLVTPFTLLELANHDQPLLKRMQFEAPGTFHHSLMVATLSEAAAEAIGANALLTRVGSLYHDIGKMKRPLFFIENQAYFGAENPHDKLTPRLSKMVITAHPRDSLEMARQHKLPEVLMKFMTEHHGTLVAGYFYNKACLEEGAENVNKSQFRYPGPKPNIKETAIVMLADACESAVRALKNPTVAQVEERIEKLIWQRVDDGQFDHCPLTFKDLTQIKDTFVRVLRGIQHNRIEYQVNIVKELKRKAPVAPVPPTQQNSGSQGA
jgi:putative nucleotidyltransferase with HDIG domain